MGDSEGSLLCAGVGVLLTYIRLRCSPSKSSLGFFYKMLKSEQYIGIQSLIFDRTILNDKECSLQHM